MAHLFETFQLKALLRWLDRIFGDNAAKSREKADTKVRGSRYE